MNEVWREIEGTLGLYEISTHGRVRSYIKCRNGAGFFTTTEPRYLKPQRMGPGYLFISIYENRVKTTSYIHRLVARAFVHNPDNYPQINHIDGNKNNNYHLNLEWCDHDYNMAHAQENDLTHKGEQMAAAKLKESQIRIIRVLLAMGSIRQYEIAKLFNVSDSTISAIKNDKAWRHV